MMIFQSVRQPNSERKFRFLLTGGHRIRLLLGELGIKRLFHWLKNNHYHLFTRLETYHHNLIIQKYFPHSLRLFACREVQVVHRNACKLFKPWRWPFKRKPMSITFLWYFLLCCSRWFPIVQVVFKFFAIRTVQFWEEKWAKWTS